MKTNPHLKSAILEIVDNQLKAGDPPETRKTLERLVSEGYSENQAKELIGAVVSSEIFDIMKKQQPFNLNRFIEMLNKLPDISMDE